MDICSRGARGLLLAGSLFGVVPAAAQMPKLTLAEAIERANRAQPSVVQAFGTVRNAQARQRSATGAFLPSLSLNLSGNNNFSEGQQLDPSTGQFTTSGTSTQILGSSISSNVDLFTGFRRTSEKRAANGLASRGIGGPIEPSTVTSDCHRASARKRVG